MASFSTSFNTPIVGTTLTTPSPPLLTLSRDLCIRPLLHSDAAAAAAFCNNIKLARNQTERWPMPYTLDCAHEFIAFVRDVNTWLPVKDIGDLDVQSSRPSSTSEADEGTKLPIHWAVALSGTLIGGVGFTATGAPSAKHRSISIGYWIAEEHWGKGYMTEVAMAYVAWLWRAYPQCERLEATVNGWNPGSMNVLRKCGFEHEGTEKAGVLRFGKRCDQLRFGLLREGVVVDEEAPTKFQ